MLLSILLKLVVLFTLPVHSAFNNVYSNLGYVLLGAVFILFIGIRYSGEQGVFFEYNSVLEKEHCTYCI